MRMILPVCSMGGLAAIWRTRSSLPSQLGFDAAEDMHLVSRAVGEMDVAGAGGNGQVDAAVDREVAVEGGLIGKRGEGCDGKRRCCEKKMLHRVPRFVKDRGQ